MGRAAAAVARRTSWSDGSSLRTSESIAASITIRPTFMNSEGVSWNPPSWNHRWAPAELAPSGVCTSTRSSIGAP